MVYMVKGISYIGLSGDPRASFVVAPKNRKDGQGTREEHLPA